MRKILVITGSRGEYGYVRPILRLIDQHPGLQYQLLVTNMHLLSEFGYSRQEFTRDGFTVEDELYMALDGSTATSMTKSLAVGLMGMADIIHNSRPDLVLLAGDRGEQLMAAVAAAHANIPVAHVQAGEVSGNIDGLTRHAIARYTHIHLAANKDAADRLVRTGEEPFRVHEVGAPQLDEFLAGNCSTVSELALHFKIVPTDPFILIVQHPVTEQAGLASTQMETTLEALREFALPTVMIYPNNDAGSAMTRETISRLRLPWLHIERNVSRELYGGLMRAAAVIVGNSSSGLLEAPSFALPAVNIGRRQEGRVRGANVIDVGHDVQEIAGAVRRALSPEFRASIAGMQNPYGDGHTSERIVHLLASIPINEALLFKRLTY